jgi:hypothetical protein
LEPEQSRPRRARLVRVWAPLEIANLNHFPNDQEGMCTISWVVQHMLFLHLRGGRIVRSTRDFLFIEAYLFADLVILVQEKLHAVVRTTDRNDFS